MYYVTVIALSHHVSLVMCFVHIIIIIICDAIKALYSKRLNRGQHGFDIAVYPQTGPPAGSTGGGVC